MSSYDLTIKTGSNYKKSFIVKTDTGVVADITGSRASLYVVENPGNFQANVFTTESGAIINGGVDGTLTVALTPYDITTISGNFYKLELVDTLGFETEIVSGNLFLLDETKIGIEYLTTMLRLRIGDTDPLTYKYSDEWLKASLTVAVKILQRWWNSKYVITDMGIISRSPYTYFETDLNVEGIIEHKDEYLIVLMAAYVVLSGSIENSAWSTSSWKDAEISFSNIEGGRMKEKGIERLWNEIQMYLTPPSKKLARVTKGSLPGFLNNQYERDTKY